MLTALGCTYAVMGHRSGVSTTPMTDEIVNAKVRAALANGLTPIMCVGEGAGHPRGRHPRRIHHRQLDGGLKGLTAEQVEKIVVAYEPVWAIGTGKTATPEDAQEVIGALRNRLAVLYRAAWPTRSASSTAGRSRAATRPASWQPDIDGALVGGRGARR